jgi:hypothetical protein
LDGLRLFKLIQLIKTYPNISRVLQPSEIVGKIEVPPIL